MTGGEDSTRLGGLAGDTLVMMADGTDKPISEIRVGDRVMSFEPQGPVDSPLRANEVIAVRAHAVCAHLVINATVQVMPGQRLLTPVGFREAGTLGIGDRLVTAGGRLEVIDGIVTLTLPPGQPPVPVRNLTVANDRTWLAEGYRVHSE